MNLLYINELSCCPEIDGEIQDTISTRDIVDLASSLKEYELKFKITGYGSEKLKKNLYDRFTKERMYCEFKELFYDGHICIRQKAKQAGYDLDYSFLLEKLNIEDKGMKTLIDVAGLVEGMLSGSRNAMVFDSVSQQDKIAKYMTNKYVQINSNGDIFMTSLATSDPKILSFILEEIHNRFI